MLTSKNWQMRLDEKVPEETKIKKVLLAPWRWLKIAALFIWPKVKNFFQKNYLGKPAAVILGLSCAFLAILGLGFNITPVWTLALLGIVIARKMYFVSAETNLLKLLQKSLVRPLHVLWLGLWLSFYVF